MKENICMLNKIKLVGSIALIASSLVVANLSPINTSQTIIHNQQLSHVGGCNRLEFSVENSCSFHLRFALSANGACLFGVGEPYNPNEKNGVIIIPPKVNNVEVTEIF